MLPIISGYVQLPTQPRFRPTESATTTEDASVVVPALEKAGQGRADSFAQIGTALRGFAENLFAAILTSRPKLVTITVNAPGYGAYSEQRAVNGISYAVAISNGAPGAGKAEDLALIRADTAPVPAMRPGAGMLLDRRV